MQRLLLLAALAAAGLSTVSAEILQTTHWALVGEAGASAGYDSNLTLSDDGVGSAFLRAEPMLKLRRIGSATRLDIRLEADLTEFARHEDFQADAAAVVDYAYPAVEGTPPRYTGNARLARYTAGNSRLGRRITANTAHADFGGEVYSTGKLAFESRVRWDREDFSDDALNTNDRYALTVGAGYDPDPRKHLTLNVMAGAGRSEPSRAGFLRSRSREYGAVLEGRGQLLPKIEGTLWAGVAAVRYRGDFRRSEVLPVAGGEVAWQATERSRFSLGLEAGADFSPLGESVKVSRLTLGLEQTIRGPWRWRARVVPSSLSYHREVFVRRDNAIGGGLALLYLPSERFSASLAQDFNHQRSDESFASYERSVTTVNVSYRF